MENRARIADLRLGQSHEGGKMSVSTFKEYGSGREISIESSAVVAFYPGEDKDFEWVTIELTNGSKFNVQTTIAVVSNWVAKSRMA